MPFIKTVSIIFAIIGLLFFAYTGENVVSGAIVGVLLGGCLGAVIGICLIGLLRGSSWLFHNSLKLLSAIFIGTSKLILKIIVITAIATITIIIILILRWAVVTEFGM